ncbi:MAG: hypothetical protein HRU50_10270 [Winogradskyella sp.]|uniref:hypothetical protein n=1 Tax=Winogradskyella sp. TaxID=1883156 RepID=UPI0025D35D54|nr:hypothetical protein [Winogradskyella sp.]NRB60304.1 hypothetical protein [Winogradskyella sp.]
MKRNEENTKIIYEIPFINHAYNFWSAASILINEMVKTGNKNMVISKADNFKSEEEEEKHLQEIFERNADSIGIPIMFNFYHGVELYMKGIFQIAEITFNSNHNLQDLYKLMKANEKQFQPNLLLLLKNLICNSNGFHPFFKKNNITVNDFYIALKYPRNKDGSMIYEYSKIRGSEPEIIEIYKNIEYSIKELKKQIKVWLQSRNN